MKKLFQGFVLCGVVIIIFCRKAFSIPPPNDANGTAPTIWEDLASEDTNTIEVDGGPFYLDDLDYYEPAGERPMTQNELWHGDIDPDDLQIIVYDMYLPKESEICSFERNKPIVWYNADGILCRCCRNSEVACGHPCSKA